MHPYLIKIPIEAPWLVKLLGPYVPLHTYGLMLALGFIAAVSVIAREADRMGEDVDRILDLTFWILVAGLVGSRVMFMIVNWADYAKDPLLIFQIWRGGLVWYGGFLGAFGMCVYFARKHRLPLFRTVDIITLGLPLGHAFGRLGCFAAGCCYGKVCSLPWGARFPSDSLAYNGLADAGALGVQGAGATLPSHTPPLHPTQLYESATELLVFFALLAVRQRKRRDGQVFLAYLVVYPIARSIIELFRGDVERGYVVKNVLSTSQFLSILVALGAAVLFVVLRRRAAPGPGT